MKIVSPTFVNRHGDNRVKLTLKKTLVLFSCWSYSFMSAEQGFLLL